MIDTKKLRDIQKKIAKKVCLKDKFKEIKTIAGFDLAFYQRKFICACIVLDYKTLEIIEKKFLIGEETMPYIPTFLAFREGPPIIKLYHELKNEPDILIVEGNGILHPLKAGSATFVGVSLDKPTIGVAKNLLCGEVKEDKVYINDKIYGFKLQTKNSANPIYISPGHNISLKSCLKIVKKCLKEHKLPEPLRLAHIYCNKIKKNIKDRSPTNAL